MTVPSGSSRSCYLERPSDGSLWTLCLGTAQAGFSPALLVLVAWHGCVPGERILCHNPWGSSSWKPCVACELGSESGRQLSDALLASTGMGIDKGELSYWEGWPGCPQPLCSAVCSSLALSSAKKGSSEDRDDISKLVTGLMKTSICRQMSYKTVEGNEVRTSPRPCVPLFGGAGRP